MHAVSSQPLGHDIWSGGRFQNGDTPRQPDGQLAVGTGICASEDIHESALAAYADIPYTDWSAQGTICGRVAVDRAKLCVN